MLGPAPHHVRPESGASGMCLVGDENLPHFREVDKFLAELSSRDQGDLQQVCSVLCGKEFFVGLAEIQCNRGFMPNVDVNAILSGVASLMATRNLLSELTNENFDCLASFFSSVSFEKTAALDSLCELMKKLKHRSKSLSFFCQDQQVTFFQMLTHCPELNDAPFLLPGLRTLLQITTVQDYTTLHTTLSVLTHTEKKAVLNLLQTHHLPLLYQFRRVLCPSSCPLPSPLPKLPSPRVSQPGPPHPFPTPSPTLSPTPSPAPFPAPSPPVPTSHPLPFSPFIQKSSQSSYLLFPHTQSPIPSPLYQVTSAPAFPPSSPSPLFVPLHPSPPPTNPPRPLFSFPFRSCPDSTHQQAQF
uniref:Uncharacterized protein n=1 Tax=Paramoeba aestuarina TaxID=180227 RepID=A0A6U2YVA9_9EUKA|mmetsp:Transcript_23080/g.35942  ORF Transcript_23080/g.35942 Transcript_23080/m.35942 type:complete len:356 (+) Transcript_23080:121-1188(+)